MIYADNAATTMITHVWVCYSTTPPHLPIAVADSADQLAQLLGNTTANSIKSAWCKYRTGVSKNTRFHRVRV